VNPQIEAALIAAIFTLIGLGGTILVALRGFYATRQTAIDTLKVEREKLDKTLAAQREQIDRTLSGQDFHAFNARFATAADKLGTDKMPVVRLAGVYAMTGLADDWAVIRQTCIEVLCGYLRMPYSADPGSGHETWEFLAEREVRRTIVRVITAHLREDAKVSWCGMDFDFTGMVLDGGDFSRSRFSGGRVNFSDAEFSGGVVDFSETDFSGAYVIFDGARFSGSIARFDGATFRAGAVRFSNSEFTDGQVLFHNAKLSGGEVCFNSADFNGGTVSLGGAEFSGGTVYFSDARFSSGTVRLGGNFTGARVAFDGAAFTGAKVSFKNAVFADGLIDFGTSGAWIRAPQFDWGLRGLSPKMILSRRPASETPPSTYAG
jgi:uncharacterized protein YjbI with pentapeptide repeats